MGGPMGVYEQDRYPFLRDELRLIEAALKDGRPVLGVCLGSQLLAAALGAKVVKGPGKEIGWYPVSLLAGARDDRLFGSAPDSFTPLHWHGDVFDLPAGAVALATSEKTPLQAYRYGENVYGLLFHIEPDAAIVAGMVRDFAGRWGSESRRSGDCRGGESAHRRDGRSREMAFGRWAAPI